MDIRNQLPLNHLSSQEVSIILMRLTESQSFHPKDPNIVCYGNELKVTYKSGTREILNIVASNKYWKEHKSRILDKFQKSVSPDEEKIDYRIVFCRGEELGTPPFKWRDKFQLGRVPDGNPRPTGQLAYYPCLFQFKVPITDDPLLDDYRSQNIFRRTFLPLIPLLQQYCTTRLINNNSSNVRHSWALTGTGQVIDAQWVQLAYSLKTVIDTKTFYPFAEPAAKQLPVSNDLKWPSSYYLSKGYSAYESLSDESREIFLLGCEWLNKAITANEKTDSYLFIMIMFEIFLPQNSKSCDGCGQPIHSITNKFKTFILDVIGDDWMPDFETALGKLYSLRSNIAHEGYVIEQHSSGLIPLNIKNDNQLIHSFALARQFLVSWLFMKSNLQ